MSNVQLFSILSYTFFGLAGVGLIVCIVLAIRMNIFKVIYVMSGMSERAAISKRKKEARERQKNGVSRPGSGRTKLINDNLPELAAIRKEIRDEEETIKTAGNIVSESATEPLNNGTEAATELLPVGSEAATELLQGGAYVQHLLEGSESETTMLELSDSTGEEATELLLDSTGGAKRLVPSKGDTTTEELGEESEQTAKTGAKGRFILLVNELEVHSEVMI